MADEYDNQTTITPCQESERNPEISATMNSQFQMVPEATKLCSSGRINKIVQEMVINPVSLPNHWRNAISEDADSAKFGVEHDKTEVAELEEKEARADDALDDPVSGNREEKGFEEELVGPVSENEERNGFEEKKVESDCVAPRILVKQQLECGRSHNVVLGEEEPNHDINPALLENRENVVSGIVEKLEFHGESDSCGDTREGSLQKCSFKISVIDETALIETPAVRVGSRKEQKAVKTLTNKEQETGGNREKGSRRKGKNGKCKNLRTDGQEERNLDLGHNDCGIGMLEGFEGKLQKKIYSGKELERLSHVGFDWQRKKWAEIYCGLGPVVQQEYDDCHHRYTNQMQKKSSNVYCNAAQSISGVAANGRGNHLRVFLH